MKNPDDSDAHLIRRISDERDQSAFEQLLERHVPRVLSFLRSNFRDTLGEPEIREVLNDTAFELWTRASMVKPSSIGGWLIKVARNAAVDLYRKRKRQPQLFGEHDPVDHISSDEYEVDVGVDSWLIGQLDEFANGLNGLQGTIMKADILAGGSADSEILARLHKTTRNSIEVTRSRVRKKFRDHIKSLELQKMSNRGEK